MKMLNFSVSEGISADSVLFTETTQTEPGWQLTAPIAGTGRVEQK